MDKITEIRKEIDKIDTKIASLLKKRLKKAQKLRNIKKSKKIDIKDKKREKEIISKLETDFEKNIFKKIIEESRKIQSHTLT